jgi:hypothetical protein
MAELASMAELIVEPTLNVAGDRQRWAKRVGGAEWVCRYSGLVTAALSALVKGSGRCGGLLSQATHRKRPAGFQVRHS